MDREKIINKQREAFNKKHEVELDWQRKISERQKLLALQQNIDSTWKQADEKRELARQVLEKAQADYETVDTEWQKACKDWEKVYTELGLINEKPARKD